MKNLDNIFSLNIVNLWTRFDYIYSLEIMWVLKGFKKMAKLEPFTLNQLEVLKEKFQELWLEYVYFKKDEIFDVDKMLFIKWKNSDYIDLYVSSDKKILQILKKLNNSKDEKKKNYLVWRLLWYPSCCIKSFLKYNYKWDVDFNLKVKENTIWKFDWRLNNLINPYSLIPFFPCSYNCKEAIKYAEKNVSIIWNRKDIKEVFWKPIQYESFWNYKILEYWIDLGEKDKIYYFE